MNPLPVILAALRRFRWTALAFTLLVAAGIGLAVALVSQERALRTGSARAADRFDLLVAAPGSQTDLLLAAVFLRPGGGAAKLLPPAVTARLLAEPAARFVAPLGFGDSHRGAPVVGTTAALVRHLSDGLAEGRLFETRREAVVGAVSPLRLGATFRPTHGEGHHAEEDGHDGAEAARHEHGAELTVVGRMRPTGSPWDRAIAVPIELVWTVHGLPDGHAPGSEAVGPPFDPARTPGIPAAIVRPDAIASAYRLRSAYTTADTMAFFPAEALRSLYAVLGDVRRLMSLLALVTQFLVLAAITASVLILFRLLAPQFATLRALGASRAYVFAVAWGFTAALLVAGALLGLAGGYGLSLGISRWLSQETGIALAPSLGFSELGLAAGVLAVGLVLAVAPAWLLQRRQIADLIAEH
jgi:putative ABC transport system permease protein